MRIGTWNLDGRWRPDDHEAFMVAADCDVWLLTEVNERVELTGYHKHLSAGLVNTKRRWAGVFSRRPLAALPDPHWASAAAVIDGTTYCSTVLPWKGCGPAWPGSGHAQQTELALADLVGNLPTRNLVWGGDWNHSLAGDECAGTKGGRAHLLAAVEKLGLQVPTAELPLHIDGYLSIDHIAVAADRVVREATRRSGRALSNHDCYVVEVDEPAITR
jgi:endonuclease/exonuclease/phosphatase family protein